MVARPSPQIPRILEVKIFRRNGLAAMVRAGRYFFRSSCVCLAWGVRITNVPRSILLLLLIIPFQPPKRPKKLINSRLTYWHSRGCDGSRLSLPPTNSADPLNVTLPLFLLLPFLSSTSPLAISSHPSSSSLLCYFLFFSCSHQLHEIPSLLLGLITFLRLQQNQTLSFREHSIKHIPFCLKSTTALQQSIVNPANTNIIRPTGSTLKSCRTSKSL